MGGQARGGGSSGATVRLVALANGSGRSVAKNAKSVEAALATGAERATAHELIEAQEPGAQGLPHESSVPLLQSFGMPWSPASTIDTDDVA